MAWNTYKNKSAAGNGSKALVGPGAPIAQNLGFVGKSYKDSWDIERAYREGMQKVTWVARCIDVIAGNQARLPIILRKDNSPDGQILSDNKMGKSSLLEVLNTKSNIGENAFIFRYRLSAQLLLGTRGVFIEKVRGRDGGIVGLNLLPPQSTAPIPDAKKFVSGYEVSLPQGQTITLRPEDVVWVRRPHPLDPYLSMTPMEAAGVAIEIENFAKLYNRNFLMNDGRPGGLLVVRGHLDDEDKEELRNRFRGNLSRAGQTTVLAADDGAEYVDVGASPRDAAYIQMRQITKEEILASFGVPESVIGNASGRTFSNASEEIRVFWTETMLPHLEPIARSLDELDDVNYVDFDTREVPVLMLYKQERERYLSDEFSRGLISLNEYRIGSGRKDVDSDLADSLLMNPNLTPIGNTKKKMESPPMMAGGPPQGAVPGMEGGAPPPEMPGMPGMPGAEAPPAPPGGAEPDTMAGAIAAAMQQANPSGATDVPMATAAPAPIGQVPTEIKTADAERAIERWSEILGRSLERVIERQQRVVMEKSMGIKTKKALSAGTMDIQSVFNMDVWQKQLEDDVRPVLFAIIQDAAEMAGLPKPDKKDMVAASVESLAQLQGLNEQIEKDIGTAIKSALNVPGDDPRMASFKETLIESYAQLDAKDRYAITSHVTSSLWNQFSN
jgi:HK97 family phage portal protein